MGSSHRTIGVLTVARVPRPGHELKRYKRLALDRAREGEFSLFASVMSGSLKCPLSFIPGSPAMNEHSNIGVEKGSIGSSVHQIGVILGARESRALWRMELFSK
jgi:hypothetical protein